VAALSDNLYVYVFPSFLPLMFAHRIKLQRNCLSFLGCLMTTLELAFGHVQKNKFYIHLVTVYNLGLV